MGIAKSDGVVVRSFLDVADLFTFEIKYSSGVTAMFIISDDLANFGRYFIESSGDHISAATGSIKFIFANDVSVYDGALS